MTHNEIQNVRDALVLAKHGRLSESAYEKALAILDAALAAPAPQPFGYTSRDAVRIRQQGVEFTPMVVPQPMGEMDVPLYTSPVPAPQQPPPDGWVNEHGQFLPRYPDDISRRLAHSWKPVWTKPVPAPQREWVGLEERELIRCLSTTKCVDTVKMTFESGPYDIDRPTVRADNLYRAIEAALRAKNEVKNHG